jgi:hypothetical protein
MELEERKLELEAQLARCLALANEDLSEVTKQNLRDLEAQIRLELMLTALKCSAEKLIASSSQWSLCSPVRVGRNTMRVARLNGHRFAVRSLAGPDLLGRSRRWHVRQARRLEDHERAISFQTDDEWRGDVEPVPPTYYGGSREDHVC